MNVIEKKLAKMRNNPKGWHIEDLKTLANRMGISHRQPGSSHVTFRTKKGRLTIPRHQPVKAVYTKAFLTLIDQLGEKR